MADIPGLIEGASEGAGLGIQFLKHLSRTGLLLHVVDIAPLDEDEDPVESIRVIQKELEKYSEELSGKPRWLVMNKTDLMLEDEVDEICTRILEETQWDGPSYRISAVTQQGTQELVKDIAEVLVQNRRDAFEQEDAAQQAVEEKAPPKGRGRYVEEDFDF